MREYFQTPSPQRPIRFAISGMLSARTLPEGSPANLVSARRFTGKLSFGIFRLITEFQLSCLKIITHQRLFVLLTHETTFTAYSETCPPLLFTLFRVFVIIALFSDFVAKFSRCDHPVLIFRY